MQELGIDRPYWVQYVDWMRQLLSGDLGKSYRYDLPAWEIIRPLVPVTLELAVLSTLSSRCSSGCRPASISAVRQDTALDYALRVFSLAGLSMPRSGWAWSSSWSWSRGSGGSRPSPTSRRPENLKLHAVQFLLPALAVGYRSSALSCASPARRCWR